MEVTIRRDDLLAELALLQGIVERRAAIQILSHLLIEARGGRLHLAGTDLDVSLATSCAAEVARDGTVAIGARKLTEIVRSLGDGDVRFEEEEPQTLTIRSGRSRFRIRGADPSVFPTIPRVVDGTEVALPAATLRSAITRTIFAISAEESRFQLNGALLRLRERSLELVATDGYRLAFVAAPLPEDRPDSSTAEGVLVPRKALGEIVKLDGDGILVLRRAEHHLAFRLGARELTCRILDGTFPDYERVLARSLSYEARVDRTALIAGVQRVALLTGERGRAVRLTFSEGQVEISAANPDLGDAVEAIPCDYVGPEIVLGLNPDYLGQFLGVVDGAGVSLALQDSESQCVGRPETVEEGWRQLCVIMPMRA
jgi:DNA polymerase-3 subunit beta